MDPTTTVYATDEDIALRAPADFAFLCPHDQKLAWGTDGVFSGSDPWTLTSAAVDFQGQGLMPGQVVQLVKPVTSFKPPGDFLTIAAVAPGAATLRRKGELPGVGQPPAAANGLTGVEFLVGTLGPQIARASYELNQRYGIDDLIAGRRSCDLYDPREVRDATVLTVLIHQYQSMSRGADDRFDPFAAKALLAKQELGELLARAVVHWRPANSPSGIAAPTTRLSTRISR